MHLYIVLSWHWTHKKTVMAVMGSTLLSVVRCPRAPHHRRSSATIPVHVYEFRLAPVIELVRMTTGLRQIDGVVLGADDPDMYTSMPAHWLQMAYDCQTQSQC